MKLVYIALTAAALIGLAGCSGAKTAALEKQLADVKAENAALEGRIAQLEGRVQAIEASLPDDDSSDH
jgi:cell division protein FtsB